MNQITDREFCDAIAATKKDAKLVAAAKNDRMNSAETLYREFEKLPLEVDALPPADALNDVLRTAGRQSREASRVEVPFDLVAPSAEALWSATAGGAAALRRRDVGRLAVGSSADFAVLDAPSYVHLAYRPGVPLVAATYRAGRPLT